jgi:hypothetical protein
VITTWRTDTGSWRQTPSDGYFDPWTISWIWCRGGWVRWLLTSPPKRLVNNWMLTIDGKTIDQWDQIFDRCSFLFWSASRLSFSNPLEEGEWQWQRDEMIISAKKSQIIQKYNSWLFEKSFDL